MDISYRNFCGISEITDDIFRWDCYSTDTACYSPAAWSHTYSTITARAIFCAASDAKSMFHKAETTNKLENEYALY